MNSLNLSRFSNLKNYLSFHTETMNDEFALYKIAFMWYCPMGALFVWTFGIIISYFTGGQDLGTLNLNLLSPAVKCLVPARYRHIEVAMDVLDYRPYNNDADANGNE